SGSAGVDVETSEEITLTDTQVQCIPTNLTGPLGHGLSALLLGRSSVTRKGIFILLGEIDSDFMGVISIMVWTPNPPVFIPKGSRVGQLVPFKAVDPQASPKERGKGFGSTSIAELYVALDIGKAKPMEKVKIKDEHGNSKTLQMLVDTGVDVTIVS
ncbi:POK9 protein, partial [Crotophaga sulcirostris]|nr:POK9 protein [Crotophaga sulcirostris]